MRKLIPIIISCFLLSGCWDEILYKELTISPLAGLDGKPGEITVYFAYPVFSEDSISYSTAVGKGVSLRAARNNTFSHTNEMLDVSQLEVFIISAEAAESNIYNHMEVLYRAPRTRLSGRVVIIKEKTSDHFDIAETLPGNAPDFYTGLLETSIDFSMIPDYNLQQTAKVLFDDAMDLALPALQLSQESGLPEVSGVALFNGKKFSGHYLDLTESRILTVLQKKGRKKYAQFTYQWAHEGIKYPITVEYSSLDRKWAISNEKIEASYKFKFGIEEFTYSHSKDKEIMKEVEQFLSKELTKDFQDVIDKLQEAKSDAVGFGQHVRAFHQPLWNQGDWSETFSEMDIKINVEADIVRSGILN